MMPNIVENLDVVFGAGIALLGVYLGNIWQPRFQAKEAQRRDRQIFLTQALKELTECYGDARKFLYLEDASRADDELISAFAKTLGTFTGLARSINDEEINNRLGDIWIQRLDNASRGKVQDALETIISRVGILASGPAKDIGDQQ